MVATVTCSECGVVLDDQPDAPPGSRKPCPCGSTVRTTHISVGGEFTSYGNLGYKGKRPGWRPEHSHPFFIEGFIGMDLSRKLGQLMRKVSIFDRVRDRRIESVVDPLTGVVLTDRDEPLVEHTGHGSARVPGKGKQ